jgi:hypothetical protein
MIFGGSSVTQGSDNMFTSAYPMVFERRMKPILDALGVDLVVHNIAQSANQCIPSELCYNSMGGENADFIGWEQSFNCGRETSMFEVIARIAGFQNAVLHFAASGSESVDECADSKTQPPRISEQWSPEVDEEIQADLKARGGARQRVLDDSGAATEHIPYTPYVPTKEVVSKFKDVLTHWGEKANSVSRFAGPLGSSYQVCGVSSLALVLFLICVVSTLRIGRWHLYSVWVHMGLTSGQTPAPCATSGTARHATLWRCWAPATTRAAPNGSHTSCHTTTMASVSMATRTTRHLAGTCCAGRCWSTTICTCCWTPYSLCRPTSPPTRSTAPITPR